MKKIIGISMLCILFGGLFIWCITDIGFKKALWAFGLPLISFSIMVIACLLIFSDNKRNPKSISSGFWDKYKIWKE
jgi:hypothetical protein